MKSFKNILALTLVELIVAIAISAVLFGTIIYFVSGNIEEVASSALKTKVIEESLSLNSVINDYKGKGYTDTLIIPFVEDVTYTGATNPNPNNILLLKIPDNSAGVVFGIIDNESLKLKNNYSYSNSFIAYRDLGDSEVLEIINNPSLVYQKEFFLDKAFLNLRAKDFRCEYYNNGEIITLYYNLIRPLSSTATSLDYSDLQISDSILGEYNLVL